MQKKYLSSLLLMALIISGCSNKNSSSAKTSSLVNSTSTNLVSSLDNESSSSSLVIKLASLTKIDMSHLTNFEAITLNENSQYTVGEKVDFELSLLSPITAYELDNIYLYLNNTRLNILSETNGSIKTLKSSFIVPENDFEIKGFYSKSEESESGYKVEINSSTISYYGIEKDLTYSYAQIFIPLPSHYTVTKFTLLEEGKSETNEVYFVNDNYIVYEKELTSNITLNVEIENNGTQKINFTNYRNIDMESASLVESASYGDDVLISGLKFKNSASTYLSSIEHNLPDSSNVLISEEEGLFSISFKMPCYDVTFDLIASKKGKVSIEGHENIKSAMSVSTPYASFPTVLFKPLDTVYIVLELNKGGIDEVLLNGQVEQNAKVYPNEATEENPNDIVVEFLMPSYDISVSFTFSDTFSCKLNPTVEGARIQFSKNYSDTCNFLPGESVEFVLVIDSLYNLEGVETNVPNLEITMEPLGYYGYYDLYSFIMPSVNVIITPNLTKDQSTSVTLSPINPELNVLTFSVFGSKSNVGLSFNSSSSYNLLSCNFSVNENLTISLTTGQVSKKILILFKDSENNLLKQINPISYGNNGNATIYNYESYKVLENLATIELSSEYQRPYNGSIVNETGLSFEYYINGQLSMHLYDIYAGSIVVFKPIGTVPEDKKIILMLVNNDGSETQLNQTISFNGDILPFFVVNDNFKIKIVLQGSVTLSKPTEVISTSLNYAFIDENGKTIRESKVTYGTQIAFRISASNSGFVGKKYRITVKVGASEFEYIGEIQEPSMYDYKYVSPYFSATGNVEVEVENYTE